MRRAVGAGAAKANPPPPGVLNGPERCPINQDSCGYDVTVACQLPKLDVRVRFPLPAPNSSANPRSPRSGSKPGLGRRSPLEPLGTVAGRLLGGRRKQVSFAAELDDGRNFMTVTDYKTRREIAAAVFEREGSDHKLKGP